MKKQKTNLGELLLVGLTARTNNQNEMTPEKSKIGALAGAYFEGQIANDIKHRVTPGTTYSIYTEYESDEHGEYTYFIGEVVESFEGQDLSQFETLTIPASDYQKFTTNEAPIPDVVISAWQQIWKMREEDFGGRRKYIADFEVYDERSLNPSAAVLDIYIGID